MIPSLRLHSTPSPRRLALLVGAGAVALAATLAVGRILQIQERAQNRSVELSASYVAYPSLEAMTRRSDLVVVGHAVDHRTRLVAQPTQQAVPFQANRPTNVPNEKSKLATATATGPVGLRPGEPAPPSMDTPVTDFTFQVSRVLQGNLAAGARITVSQPGGEIQLPTFPGGPMLKRTVQFEHDPIIAAGQEQVLFLGLAKDGTYYVVGGPQGRLSVDKGGKLHPIDPAAPATRGKGGQTLESFVAEVQRSRPNNQSTGTVH